MKKLILFFLFVVLLGIVLAFFYRDSTPPEIAGGDQTHIGRSRPISVTITDPGKGLRSVAIRLRQNEQETELLNHDFGRRWFFWQNGPLLEEITITPEGLQEAQLEEGDFQLQVRAVQQSNFFFFSPAAETTFDLKYDLTPPRVQILSGPHYLRQGGSEAAVYVVDDAARSGVKVGDRLFQGVPLPEGPPGGHVVLFALPHDQDRDISILAWAEDAAGNEVVGSIDVRTLPGRFRQRRINVDDSFMNKVSTEILPRTDQISTGETPVETYLAINRDLRKLNNARIEELTQPVSPAILWTEPFLQLTNSQVESSFADYRTYLYRGQEIDRQTHLGFDLASLARSPVEASNAGVVAFADYLGIYGNCVILDHGLGLYSLYGHLSEIGVEPGQQVERGSVLGKTGETGLAGGDHLHFSMVLQGVQVNPIEWWDPQWVRDHLTSRMAAVQTP